MPTGLSDKPAKPTMKIAAMLLLSCAVLAGARAQPADPLKSPACDEGLAQLESARAGAASAATIETLRSAAAAACLGTGTLPSRPARIAQPPIAVPPPRIEPPRRVAPLPPPALPAPPLVVERAPMPALCDAAGCWSPDGSHLRHVPPNLVGPQGPCSLQGGLVYCP